jgi:RNA polymerase sigma-70 factor (ECF subfamily)
VDASRFPFCSGVSVLGNLPTNNDEFLRRFVRHQQDLYAYILSLVPNIADAQDILQETSVALWAKADEYRMADPFMPWAARFAWFQVRKFRLYQARHRKHVIALSESALEALVSERMQFAPGENVANNLQHCVDKLAETDRKLLHQRYALKDSIRDVALKAGVDPEQLYKRLGRIRQLLIDCIHRTSLEQAR